MRNNTQTEYGESKFHFTDMFSLYFIMGKLMGQRPLYLGT